jgi:membrane-associated phospholipid phosphatase
LQVLAGRSPTNIDSEAAGFLPLQRMQTMEIYLDGKTASVVPAPLLLSKWAESTAHWVSQIGCPPVCTLAGYLVAAQQLATPDAWTWAAVCGLLAVLLPLAYVVQLVSAGKVGDLHLNNRAQRIRPLLVSLGGATAAVGLMGLFQAPELLRLIAAANVVQVAAFLAITLRWKISAHGAAATGMVVLCCALWGSTAALLALGVLLVGWARLRLQRHTPAQVLAGALIGAMLWGTALSLYGG